jgi:hypothetical protein
MLQIVLFFISFAWVALWLKIADWSGIDWLSWFSAPGIIYIVGMALYMIIGVWIIGPIKRSREKKED